MTHEIKQLFHTLKNWQQQGEKAVFVSVVALDGSSYRRPGVRMIINDSGEMAGAVSGGCVEKEIERQAQSVFRTGIAKLISYDGRLRIGCEGIIYMLIEPAYLSEELLNAFDSLLKKRQPFKMETYYQLTIGETATAGTLIHFPGRVFPLNPAFNSNQAEKQACFAQHFEPLFQLYIFGAEHDAVHLSQAANLLGWEVTIVASADEPKSCDYFPGADSLITPAFDAIGKLVLDEQTAVVLMTHSFNKDVQYLLALKNIHPAYLGMIGSIKRRERVLSMLMDYDPEISPEFLDLIHGPAGINIGAESASEIAVSILAEILSVIRHQKPIALREKVGSIHG
ncbi:XdhC family protein [Mangrovibacterium lignilyticum]|uniref:XdhC family protein n=1 Tax=Mangrovibacterium lignilyticum TaxID=2668052 RepID=UPI0013D7AF52|nr:XdhC/CoxI family protein [Mangrovibacterium lignilyticum]